MIVEAKNAAIEEAADNIQTKITEAIEGPVAQNTAAINANAIAVNSRIDSAEARLDAVEREATAYALKTEVTTVAAEFENYTKLADYNTDKSNTDVALADRYTKSEVDTKFAAVSNVEVNTNNIEAIKSNYVKLGANDSLYVGEDSTDEIIFDCGSAGIIVGGN
jgi:hypothetical protein